MPTPDTEANKIHGKPDRRLNILQAGLIRGEVHACVKEEGLEEGKEGLEGRSTEEGLWRNIAPSLPILLKLDQHTACTQPAHSFVFEFKSGNLKSNNSLRGCECTIKISLSLPSNCLPLNVPPTAPGSK